MHRTIVVAAAEGEPLRDAFTLGVALARPRGAEIVLAHVDLGEPQPVTDLQQLAATAPPDVPARAIAVSAPTVVAGLHLAVTEHRAELLVLGASHVSSVARMMRGDVALGVVRDASCGVAVAPLGHAATGIGEPRRIGVAWDTGPEAGEALEWAVQLAERTAGEVRIIHVLDVSEEDQDVRPGLEALRRLAEERVPATIDIRRGDAADALMGEPALDVLVVGSRALGPVRRVTLGSVSAKVIHHATFPVVVLPRGVHAPIETAV